MDTFDTIPFAVHLDDGDTPIDLIGALALGRFVAGYEPWSLTRSLRRVRREATLLPWAVVPARVARANHCVSRLAVGDGWTLLAVRWRDRSAVVTVTASTEELAEEVMEAAVDGAEEPAPPRDREVGIGFWRGTKNGGRRSVRTIAAAPWSDIRANYEGTAAVALDTLMAMEADRLPGRLVLLHGPPGTGKTTALRALAQAWRDWCGFDYVLDPEHLLHDVGYLMDVIVEDDGRQAAPWRLLVLEDCDELLRADAKHGTGQALSRLLNLTDGLVGQGLDVLVCITTNEELTRLHPAITRPGRCLAEIYVGPLSGPEAAAWLGESNAPVGTLAELYARRGDLLKVDRPADAPSTGQYL